MHVPADSPGDKNSPCILSQLLKSSVLHILALAYGKPSAEGWRKGVGGVCKIKCLEGCQASETSGAGIDGTLCCLL